MRCFDPGVVRALRSRHRDPLEESERGFLLETWILHDLRAAISYQNLGGELRHWRTPSGSEVDFVWTRGRRAVGIEVKASARWKPGFGGALKSLAEARIVQAAACIWAASS
jgi:predicted AAA+ superfamily ATPase